MATISSEFPVPVHPEEFGGDDQIHASYHTTDHLLSSSDYYNSGLEEDQGGDDDEEEEESDISGETLLHIASFQELEDENVNYDTVIWVLISLLLILAWGSGLIMLLYLPIRRHILRKDIRARKLYITPTHIVYKVTRPSFVPFLGSIRIERRIPLPLVIDVIIEQGCIQARYRMHTFRIENIAHGKPAPVDELLIQGVTDPHLLRKVIITEAARCIEEFGKSGKPAVAGDPPDITMQHSRSLTEPGAYVNRSFAISSTKLTSSPRHRHLEPVALVDSAAAMHKIEEMEQSLKKIESMINEGPQVMSEIT